MDSLYSQKILELSANIPRLGRLDAPDASATRHAKFCGSEITVDLCFGQDGRISDYAQEVEACALGRTAASIVARHVVGETPSNLICLRDQMRQMLTSGGPAPTGKWQDLGILASIAAFPARHASTMLVFDAIADAIAHARS